jgi:hypothetical protein
MNILKPIPALLAICLIIPLNGHAQIAMTEAGNGLYDTGLDPTGATLFGGNNDTHYVIISAPGGAGVTSGNSLVERNGSLPAAWVANATGSTPPSRWISTEINGASQPAGVYDYRLTLTNITAGSLVLISGNIAADNQVNILADGTLKFSLTTNASYAGSFNAFSFSYTSSGTSTSSLLDFNVTNTGTSTTGLQVQGLTATYTPVPEPRDTMMAFLLGAGVLMAIRKLRQRFVHA